LQRKPKNRLGLRGAAEVKEHPWIKYFPWKDLYTKTFESPFKHNILEPWDAKYVNTPDKLGMETRDRYENIIRSESYKVVFNDYYFYFNTNDLKDKYNSKLRILPCDHDKLQNGVIKYANASNIVSQSQQNDDKTTASIVSDREGNDGSISNRNSLSRTNSLVNNSSISKSNIQNQGVNTGTTISTNTIIYKKVEPVNEIKVMTNIESKFSKIKQISNSTSTNSLLRQYKVSGGSSYVSNKFAGSQNTSLMSNNSKTNVKISSISSNSTGISNQNQNVRSSSIIKK